MIGHELGRRYEVIERVGGGGMALVYKARDTLLNRKVAVKVLRQQFTSDDDFIRRFRREAQAAASLSHPNVVSIYDVGQEDDIYYIVMEYVEGTTLADKIKENGPVQIEEAVHIAGQICDALDHAHHSQIIHRDIKPHNILIGKNGRVKVTDFGIARATAAADITQTGAVLGSVHYFSPEHAKGVAQGAKSDLYSLGIVLYQMVTGKLPFLGESPISVALKHLQENVEEPRKVNPHIPQSVENIILKAMRKNPDERYSSAKQMLADLETCLQPERRNEPKRQYAADDERDDERTLIMPAIREGRFAEHEHDDDEWDGKRRRSLAWIKPVVWIVVVVLLLGAMWMAISKLQNVLEVEEVEVPNVVGKPLAVALQELADVNLGAADPIEYVTDNDVEENIVLSQEKAGLRAKVHSTIKLVVSKGPETIVMDDYVGEEWRNIKPAVEAKFGEYGVEVTEELLISDEPAGTVISQQPKTGEVIDPRKIEVVVIGVSQGPGTIPMPNLIGMQLSGAEVLLEREGLQLKVEREKAYVPKDMVFSQYPYQPEEPVEPGSVITLRVSDGLPDDAVEYLKAVTVPPVNPGEKTAVRVIITDASGSNKEWLNREITNDTPLAIRLVLSPNTNAVVTIFRNDVFYNSYTVTYSDALLLSQPEIEFEDGMGPEEEPEPEETEPVDAPPDDNQQGDEG